jgi:hypothetical protein
LTLSAPAGGHQKILDGCFLKGLRHGELKVPSQILNRLFSNVVDEIEICRLLKMQVVITDEPPSLFDILEIQSMPIKN